MNQKNFDKVRDLFNKIPKKLEDEVLGFPEEVTVTSLTTGKASGEATEVTLVVEGKEFRPSGLRALYAEVTYDAVTNTTNVETRFHPFNALAEQVLKAITAVAQRVENITSPNTIAFMALDVIQDEFPDSDGDLLRAIGTIRLAPSERTTVGGLCATPNSAFVLTYDPEAAAVLFSLQRHFGNAQQGRSILSLRVTGQGLKILFPIQTEDQDTIALILKNLPFFNEAAQTIKHNWSNP